MNKIKTLLVAALAFWAVQLSAQEGMFGYIDFNSTLKLMPDYIDAEITLHKIQADYREEIERSKREFERQYIDFMLEQDNLSPSIVAKRQKELQLLMDNNAQFRDNVQAELEEKRADLLNPIRKKLLSAISEVCLEKGLDYIIDTGAGAYLYINQDKGVDISLPVFSRVGIDKLPNRIIESGQPFIISDSQESENKSNE